MKKKKVPSQPIQKEHSGRYGDLKLLAISVALVVGCIAGTFIIRNKNVDEKATGTPFDTPVTAEQQVSVESPLAESDESDAGIAAPAYPFQRPPVAPVTPEERKEALSDMADQIPKDQIIVF